MVTLPSNKSLVTVGRVLWMIWPSLSIAAVFLITWIHPYTFGRHTYSRLSCVLMLEFLSIHSFLFVGGAWSVESTGKRVGCLSVVLPFYLLFAWGLSVVSGGWRPLSAFLGITVDRFRFISTYRKDEKRLQQMGMN